MDCSLPGSSVHGILQARILEWVAISFCRRSSQPRDRTQVSCIAGRFFTNWAMREVQLPFWFIGWINHKPTQIQVEETWTSSFTSFGVWSVQDCSQVSKPSNLNFRQLSPIPPSNLWNIFTFLYSRNCAVLWNHLDLNSLMVEFSFMIYIFSLVFLAWNKGTAIYVYHMKK